MKTTQKAFALPSLNLLLCGLLFAVALAGLLFQVALRQEIGRTAQSIETYERELKDLERKNQFISSQLAEAHRPDALLRKIGDDLGRPTEQQIVWVRRGYDADGNRRSIAYSKSFDVARSEP